ncbi:MAG: hypothetical protein U1E22_09760, partial [Coriobacteriia bacterium]|nr:hypothetical protein [Coriobacteriia bacterium]
SGWVRALDHGVCLTEQGLQLSDVARRKMVRVWENLFDDVGLRVGGEESLGPILMDVLVALFGERAAEAVSLAFASSPVQTSSSSLYEMIAGEAARIGDGAVRFRFIAYVVDMLRRPNQVQRTVIDYLAKALFCSHALKMDAPSSGLAAGLVGNKTLIVDSNILISLLALRSPQHAELRTLMDAGRDAGIALVTTVGFVEETRKHANWAREFEERSVGDDSALLLAATGAAGWDGNDFLSGFMAWRAEDGTASRIHPYLAECVGGGAPTSEGIATKLAAQWGVTVVSVDDVCRECGNGEAVYRETLDFVMSEASADKTARRQRSEAEAYTTVFCWPGFSVSRGLSPEAYVLSAGGYLNKIARCGPHLMDTNVVVTAYTLGGFLSTYVNANAVHDFSAIIRAEFFASSAEFVDEKLLERDFDAAITSAERVFEERLRPLIQELEAGLLPSDLPEDLSGVPKLQRPEAVRSLARAVEEFVSPEAISEIKAENRELKKRLDEYDADRAREDALRGKRQKGKGKYDKAQANREKRDRH